MDALALTSDDTTSDAGADPGRTQETTDSAGAGDADDIRKPGDQQ